jgi:adenylate kinase family enzyme
MNKIIVFGGCGHGKTFFAKKLSEKINLPAFDLDEVTFNKKFTKKVLDSTRDSRLKKIISKKRWIIEGAYAGDWLLPAVKKSDFIIILNTHSIVAVKRILVRFLKRKFSRENKGGPFRDLPRIIKYGYDYKNDYFPKHINFAKKYRKEFVILRNKFQIKNFLDKIKNGN